MLSTARSSGAMLVFAVLACRAEDPNIIWRGELVDYSAPPSHAARLCLGTGPRLDAGAVRIAERLGFDEPERFTYVWAPTGLEASPCEERVSGGCMSDGTIYARATMGEHEVVHVYAALLGRADPFLEEGLAEYLAGTHEVPSQGDPTMLYGNQRHLLDPAFYAAAGRFTGALVALSSMDEVLDLYAASGYWDDLDAFLGKLQTHTGVTPAAVIDTYDDQPSCSSLAYREDLVVCGGEATELSAESEDVVEVQIPMQCESSRVWGVEGALRAHAAVDVRDGGQFRVAVHRGTTVTMTPCAPGCAFGDPITLEPLEPYDGETEVGKQILRIPAGRYGLRFKREGPGLARIDFHPF